MPLPTLPSSQMDSPLGGSSMYSDSPAPAEGGMSPTGQQAAQEKQSSFIAQHKQLTEQLQAMAQGFPEFAPAAGKMMEISKKGLVDALGAMSASQRPEQPTGGFLS